MFGGPLAVQLTTQPGSCEVPVANYSIRRYAECFGSLLYAAPSEKSHLEYLALAVIAYCKLLECQIESHDLLQPLRRQYRGRISLHMDGLCTPTRPVPRPGMIHQDASHDLGCDGKEMRPASPVDLRTGQQTQKRLLNKRGRLNHIAVAFTPQPISGYAN